VHMSISIIPHIVHPGPYAVSMYDKFSIVLDLPSPGPAVPPAPSNVSASHPLLVRQNEPHAVAGSMAARIHRAGRPQRGTYRYNPNTQTLHVHYTAAGGARQHNPPALLQRLGTISNKHGPVIIYC
jgi:hypothetical protein